MSEADLKLDLMTPSIELRGTVWKETASTESGMFAPVGSPPLRARQRRGFTLIEMLLVVVIVCMLAAMLLPAIQQAREAARRVACQNKLLQIGLALQNYSSAHGVLPPGVVNATGPIVANENVAEYHMSWIVQMLPFLELKNEYHHVDFTRSVYAPENAAVRLQRLNVLRCPSSTSQSGPDYAGIHNDFETPIDTNQNGVLFLNSSIRLSDVTDGRTNTMFVVETNSATGSGLGWMSGTSSTLRNAVIWTTRDRPDEPPRYVVRTMNDRGPSIQQQLADLERGTAAVGGPGSVHSGGFNCMMGDGAVRMVSPTVDPFVLRNLAHRADGEMPGEF